MVKLACVAPRLSCWRLAVTLIVLLATQLCLAGGKIDEKTCSFNGKKLYGKIGIVTSFPDIKVKVVSSFPDLKVQKVHSFPSACGKWEFVTSFPDTTVQFVDSFPDVQIEFVDSFPGLK